MTALLQRESVYVGHQHTTGVCRIGLFSCLVIALLHLHWLPRPQLPLWERGASVDALCQSEVARMSRPQDAIVKLSRRESA